MPGEGYLTPQGAVTNKYGKMMKQLLDQGQSKELGEKCIMCHCPLTNDWIQVSTVRRQCLTASAIAQLAQKHMEENFILYI